MTLRRYREQRDFRASPELPGSFRPARCGRRSYVVQRHAARRLHYDFRLELGGVLKSWAVPKTPALEPGDRRLAVPVEDHPLEYQDFQGEIPKGQYGAGRVEIWDRGRWMPEGDPEQGYRTGRLSFSLDGKRLTGRWSLVRMRPKAREKRAPWLLIRRRGLPAASRREAEAPRAPAMPQTLPFQLCTAVNDPPEGDEWLHELKLDGYRLACRIEDGCARLTTRSARDWTHRFPQIARAAARLPVDRAWLDGEVVAFDASGLSRFSALQAALAGAGAPLVYVAFDCLWLNDRDLRQETLEARKKLLSRLLTGAEGRLRALDHIVGRGERFYREACRQGAEGIVSKRADGVHEPGRSPSWQKLHCASRQEFVVGGYTPEAGKPRSLGALLVGTYQGDRLVYAGRVGTGFDTATRADLVRRLAKLHAQRSPFDRPISRREARQAHFVEPKLVVEVRFKEWTDGQRLRQPVFLGVRQDKSPRSVVRERAGEAPARGRAADARSRAAGAKRKGSARPRTGSPDTAAGRIAGVAISHPERVVFPDVGVTKLDLARYYDALWPHIEPHLRDRPLSVVRCPDGRSGDCFFQKHPFAREIDGVRPVNPDGHPGLVVDSRAGLVGLIQNGVVELHASGARTSAPTRPDRLVLDLDPDPDLPFLCVRDEALRLHDLLAEIGMESFVKTTGGKGLHVAVSIATTPESPDWTALRRFTRSLGKALAARPESLVVLSMSKRERRGRIYFDDARNRPGATAVLPYSVRARPGAPVAAPITWTELRRGIAPGNFSMGAVVRRIARQRKPPWPDLDQVGQRLELQPEALS